MLHTGSRMPQLCSQTVTEHANKLSKQQPGERGSFSKELMRPSEERPAWHGEQLWPVYTEFSLGGGARSLPDHSQRWLEDKGAWETPVGEGPPWLREGLSRSAPWMVCCCLDSACCRKSAPLYLEPCSGEREQQRSHITQAGLHHTTRIRKQDRACTGRRNRRGEIGQASSRSLRGRDPPTRSCPSSRPLPQSLPQPVLGTRGGEWWHTPLQNQASWPTQGDPRRSPL